MNTVYLAALEIGSHKVRTVVGEPRPDNQAHIMGYGECPSRGVRKGEIVDFDNALSCVRSSLLQAEEASNVTIYQVHLVFSGGHIKSMTNRGTVPVTDPDRIVTQEAVDNAMNNARAVNLPVEREVIHTIGQTFFLDDQQPLLRPIGMEAGRLSVDMLILHAIRNRMRNTIRVAAEADVNVEDSAFSALASAMAVLTADQKEGGVLLIDLGAGTTDYIAYAGKIIALAGALALGGDHVTNDIALGLNLPTAQAERLKISDASCMPDLARRQPPIRIPPEGGFEGRDISHSDLNLITHARMEETLLLIRDELDQRELRRRLSAGVVLVGGGAQMRDVTRLAERIFEVPATIGVPRGLSGLTEKVSLPECSACVGMLRYAIRNMDRSGAGSRFTDMLKTIFRKR